MANEVNIPSNQLTVSDMDTAKAYVFVDQELLQTLKAKAATLDAIQNDDAIVLDRKTFDRIQELAGREWRIKTAEQEQSLVRANAKEVRTWIDLMPEFLKDYLTDDQL